MSGPERVSGRRYGRYLALAAALVFVVITVDTLLTRQSGLRGVEPGHMLPPFAVPLALGNLEGDADIATRVNEGAAGRVPACSERGTQILNVCQLYEQGPVVLALFVNGGSCPAILSDLQALSPSFPGVRFAAVAIKGNRDALRRLVRSMQLTFPVGIDPDGALATLYKVVSCPQLTFAYQGGVVQSAAIQTRPSRDTLDRRLSELVTAARARGRRAGA